ncbi:MULTISPECIES: hypothetical protein [unclassified Leifsonia]|uniref:hypothetical protein n=1 Tax=unclassified Leifsonia TaxID=2663824 RepID=UPI0006F9C817|nr:MULTISPECIES: hypothetical protein [unclassified Leifsonia]KQX07440.1 hypothetical protein ASC59_06670 [Leifsonia sp. Root1293]KRA11722.1 hypothetical protein ASD61_06670 [Leifsonia sp. Root60]
MDRNTALHVLRLDPVAPLTTAVVDAAYAREAAARHPSRYPDADGRRAAEEWATTLVAARTALLDGLPASRTFDPRAVEFQPARVDGTAAAVAMSPTAIPYVAPVSPAAPRRLSALAIVGITVGAIALVIVATGTAVGALGFAGQMSQNDAAASDAAAGAPAQGEASEEDLPYNGEAPAVEYYTFEQTGFTFETALEVYHDGRLGGCPPQFERGCWEAALIPETSCGRLYIRYTFSNDDDSEHSGESRAITRTDVKPGEPVELVFGNDLYDSGWVDFVSSGAPPTAPPVAPTAPPFASTTPPMES